MCEGGGGGGGAKVSSLSKRRSHRRKGESFFFFSGKLRCAPSFWILANATTAEETSFAWNIIIVRQHTCSQNMANKNDFELLSQWCSSRKKNILTFPEGTFLFMSCFLDWWDARYFRRTGKKKGRGRRVFYELFLREAEGRGVVQFEKISRSLNPLFLLPSKRRRKFNSDAAVNPHTHIRVK